MSDKIKILLVEDDTSMGFLLVDFLESNGFDVKLYKNGLQGLKAFAQSEYDFCILDVMLPGLDGFSIAQKIRLENKQIPIIFLTAKTLVEDRVKGFNIGVDDYIIKPFDEEELLCRIRAILSRCAQQKLSNNGLDKILIGKYIFDHENLSLRIGDINKRLTQKENEVLKMLAFDKNKVVKRDDILISLWGDNDYFNSRSLDVFIAKIRKYLKSDPRIRIENIPSVGYVLSDD